MIRSVSIFLLAFVAMESFSYLVHRFIYHGIGWRIHKSHHTHRTGTFELNDVFPLFFSLTTVGLMLYAASDPLDTDLLAATVGIAVYGVAYFLVHDLYVHRRSKKLAWRIPFLRKVKQAHAVHHRHGGEPYGLFLFADPKLMALESVDEAESV